MLKIVFFTVYSVRLLKEEGTESEKEFENGLFCFILHDTCLGSEICSQKDRKIFLTKLVYVHATIHIILYTLKIL